MSLPPITKGQVRKMFDSEWAWGRYAIRTGKKTPEQMIEWLKERYTINEKLIELVNEIEIEKE